MNLAWRDVTIISTYAFVPYPLQVATSKGCISGDLQFTENGHFIDCAQSKTVIHTIIDTRTINYNLITMYYIALYIHVVTISWWWHAGRVLLPASSQDMFSSFYIPGCINADSHTSSLWYPLTFDIHCNLLLYSQVRSVSSSYQHHNISIIRLTLWYGSFICLYM